MAPTVTRLILSIALLAAAPVLMFVGTFVSYEVLDVGYRSSEIMLLTVTLSCAAVVGLGWWWIWRGEILMTPSRRLKTSAAGVTSILVGVLVGGGVGVCDLSVFFFFVFLTRNPRDDRCAAVTIPRAQ